MSDFIDFTWNHFPEVIIVLSALGFCSWMVGKFIEKQEQL